SIGEDGKARILPAVAQGRSQGSWSDGLRVSTALLSGAVAVAVDEKSGTVANDGLLKSGLLPLTYPDSPYLIPLILIDIVEATETIGSGDSRRAAQRATIQHSLWLAELDETTLPDQIENVTLFGRVESGETYPVLHTCVRWRKDSQWCERCDGGPIVCT